MRTDHRAPNNGGTHPPRTSCADVRTAMTNGRLSLGRKPHKYAGEPRACEPGVEWAERQDRKAAVAYIAELPAAGPRRGDRGRGGGTRSASGHHTVLDARVHSAHSAPWGWLCVHTKIPTPQSAHDAKLSFVTKPHRARALIARAPHDKPQRVIYKLQERDPVSHYVPLCPPPGLPPPRPLLIWIPRAGRRGPRPCRSD